MAKINEPSYTVWTDGVKFYAQSSLSASIDYTNSDASTVINSAITALTNGGIVTIKNGTYTLTTSILFPTGTGPGQKRIILKGEGMYSTKLNYTPATGYALKFDDSTLHISCAHNEVKDMTIGASNTTGGVIYLCDGAFENYFENLNISDCSNGSGIVFHSVSGNLPINNVFVNIIAEDGGNLYRNIYNIYCDGTGQAGGQFLYCQFNNASNTCFYNQSTGIFIFDGGQLKSYGTYAINQTGLSNSYFNNIYIDNGFCNCTNGIIVFNGGSVTKMITTVPGYVMIQGYTKNLQGYYHSITDYEAFPLKRAIEAETYSALTGTASVVADAAASGGEAVQFIAQSDVALYYFYYSQTFGGYLPRGKYLITIYAKDTNQVSTDLRLYVKDATNGTYDPLIKDFTLTSSYSPHSTTFTINANNDGHNIQIQLFKRTATANTITVDYFELTYLGSEFSTKITSGGQHYLLFSDAGSLPTADSGYRGMLACVQGGVGARDTLYMCMKSDANAYSWVNIKDGGA